MNEREFDAALGALLAPPLRTPDRLFAARIDVAVDDLARLHAAERRYALGLLHEIVALVAALLAGMMLARAMGIALDGWLVALPTALLLLVMVVGNGRQSRAGSSPAP
jgi:hypothetical protein